MAGMKAMVLTGPGELTLDEVVKPGNGAGQVLVKVTHSGICGTDYKIFNGSIPVRYPRIMGHEMAGEVVDAGDSSLRPGERVIVDPELYCGNCFHCRIGQTHLCPNGQLLGRDANGGFAEYLGMAIGSNALSLIVVGAYVASWACLTLGRRQRAVNYDPALATAAAET